MAQCGVLENWADYCCIKIDQLQQLDAFELFDKVYNGVDVDN